MCVNSLKCIIWYPGIWYLSLWYPLHIAMVLSLHMALPISHSVYYVWHLVALTLLQIQISREL